MVQRVGLGLIKVTQKLSFAYHVKKLCPDDCEILVKYWEGEARHYVSALLCMKKNQTCVVLLGFETTYDTCNSLVKPTFLILKVV